MTAHWKTSRRALLASAALAAFMPAFAWARGRTSPTPGKVRAFPLFRVRLLPSPFLTAVEANRAYLHRLEPDRLLHNYRKSAGLEPKGEIYGGWESDTIAGHTLGHYLSDRKSTRLNSSH